MDDSKLAAPTTISPVFSVVRNPRFGCIRKIIPSSNGQTPHQQRLRRQAAKEKDTSVFTHEDIQSEFIFYVLRKLDLNESTIDSLEYVLTAPNVQPAFGTLEFMVLPTGTLMAASKSSIDGSVPNSGRKDGPRHDNPPVVPNIVTENPLPGMGISSDIMLIVGIICGVLVLGLVILIAVRSVFIHSLRTEIVCGRSFAPLTFFSPNEKQVSCQAPSAQQTETRGQPDTAGRYAALPSLWFHQSKFSFISFEKKI